MSSRRLSALRLISPHSAFIVQLGGAFMTTTTDINTENIGLKIYTGGVGLQEAFILFFLSIAVQFHIRIRASGYVDRLTNWKALLYVLYGTLTLITVSAFPYCSLSFLLPFSNLLPMLTTIGSRHLSHRRVCRWYQQFRSPSSSVRLHL